MFKNNMLLSCATNVSIQEAIYSLDNEKPNDLLITKLNSEFTKRIFNKINERIYNWLKLNCLGTAEEIIVKQDLNLLQNLLTFTSRFKFTLILKDLFYTEIQGIQGLPTKNEIIYRKLRYWDSI